MDDRRRLRLLVAAATVSSAGDGMTIVATPLLAAHLTDDPRVIAGLRIAAVIPWVTLSLTAGVAADRLSRRRLMIAADVARAVILAVLAVLAFHELDALWPLFAVVLAVGIAQTVFDSTAQGFLADVVPDRELDRAASRMFAGQSIGLGAVGPPLGSLLFSWEVAAPFAIDAITFMLSAVLLLAIGAVGRPSDATVTAPVAGHLKEILAGLQFTLGHPLLRTFLVLTAVVGIAHAASGSLMVLLALDVLRMSDVGYGILIGLESVGLFVGSLLADRIRHRLGRGKALRLAILCTASTPLLIGLSPNAAWAFAVTALDGFTLGVWGVLAVSTRLHVIPRDLQGRVTSIFRLSAQLAVVVGALAAGLLAEATTLRTPMVAAGALALAVVVVRARRLQSDELQTFGLEDHPQLGGEDFDEVDPPARQRVVDTPDPGPKASPPA